MKIAILRERRPNETRVAGSPETVKKFVSLGIDVCVEKGAGTAASMSDSAFREAGATIGADAKEALAGADLILKVQRPMIEGEKSNELADFQPGQTLVCQMSALSEPEFVSALAASGVTGFALELMPRITRAQSMDILSSQSNLAGYKAVLDAAAEFGRAFPMMMTAAGTVPPARGIVMGVGVAGLQAIATAKRLGAVVSATDVRPATKEQVESLGGTFVAVEDEEFAQAQTDGGYAKEMSDAYKEKQAALIAETIPKQDIVICTALIPGRPAPVLVSEEMVKTMKPGSVIVDLAVEAGGNCPLSKLGKVVAKNGVKIVGHANVPGRLADDASKLFARNIYNFLTPMVDEDSQSLTIDTEDEIVSGTLVTRDGAVVNDAVPATSAPSASEPEPVLEGEA
ncbi:MAG: Re/Si-specific NAD(P)(+) transhydrogenase subunit alpha [Rhodospirillaceae bacterium]|nr:Re/Si-specific NAD(P)(+) transhydrogenase subunit alpha [Rhodospirillaceae bacterium]